MISDRALTALRCGAAILHCTSGVRLRLSHDGAPLFEISHPPFPDVDHAVLPPCRFRAAVARAHADHGSGREIAMCGLPDGVDPDISYGVREEDRVLPGGALRLERDAMWLHVTAIAGTGPSVNDALTCHEIDGELDLQTLVDDELGVTIVCIVCAAGDERESARSLDALCDLTARVAVAEVEAYLAGVADLPSPRDR